ncbi:hypothetical protein ACFL5M_06190 [Candidatus Neomarinimicrobiota bacterium]
MTIRFTGFFLCLIICFTTCDESVTTDDSLPTAIELNPIICHDSTFAISWPVSEDEDFASYTLYKALVESMILKVMVFESTQRQDTAYAGKELETGKTYYYQLVVANTHGNSAFSSAQQATADCLRGPTASELRIITYQDNAFTITWYANRDEDFASYALYEAYAEDMAEESIVYQTTEREDTSYTVSGVGLDEDRYYRVQVANSYGNRASSRIELATTELRIVFASDRTGANNIYLMDIHGRNQRGILSLPEYSCAGCGGDCDEWTPLIEASTPLFYPDGDRILFLGRQETYADPGFFSTNLNGSMVEKRNVIGPGCCQDIEFPPLGDAYYYVNGLGGVFRVNTASCSSKPHNYPIGTDINGGFSISPDGNYIAFHACGMAGGCGIIVADVFFANQPTQIWGPNDYYPYYYPVFTPDSQDLIFYAVKPTGAHGLFRMALDGTGQVPLDTTLNSIQQVQIAPDGSGILYRKRVSSWGLYTMNLDGSDQTLLANTTGEPKNFQYSSDGQYICFEAGGQVWIMQADGFNLTQLTTEGGYSPAIQPRE